MPTESLIVSVATLGEGWHNYHHTFPWDYRAAEFGKLRFNLTTSFINLMAALGWAYDLKIVSEESIIKRAMRTGDGTRKIEKIIKCLEDHEHSDDLVWGWGDKDMTKEYLNYVKISNRKLT